MSPLWRDLLRIVIAPDRISAVRYGKGLRPKEIARKSLPCHQQATEEEGTRAILQALSDLLAAIGGNADAELILSNHLARYALIPSQRDLDNADEETRFVRYCFSETYGEKVVANWSLRCAGGLVADAQVASAVDHDLLDGLDKTCANSNVRVTSIQPFLMAAFNHFRHGLSVGTQWIVLVEPGRLCLGLVESGAWACLRTIKTGAQWAEELPVILDREMQVSGRLKNGGALMLLLPVAVDRSRISLPGFSMRMVVVTPESLMDGNVQPISSLEARA